MEFLTNKFFLIALTFLAFVSAQYLQRKTGYKFLNPILLSIASLICFLIVFKIDYSVYKTGGDYIDFWLGREYNFGPLIQSMIFMSALSAVVVLVAFKVKGRKN